LNEEVRVLYRVHISIDEDGMFVAECPALPDCISQGKTRHEAVENIKDAIDGYLESLKKHNEPIPPSIDEEVVEVAV
jgi:predicted RNase H-like HicB family nuclease